jgi:hypothetical protein
MARKDLSQIERKTVEAAVAGRYPDLPPEVQRKYASRVIEYVADLISQGAYPASIALLSNGEVKLDYLTIEDILAGVDR